MTNYHLAVDIGASSGRLVLGALTDGKLTLTEMHRFANGVTERNGRLCWDLEGIFREIITGLKKCAAAGRIPDTVGIDTWGVDFVLLDDRDRIIGDTVAYRDHRTDAIDRELYELVPESELYARTGIQHINFNSIYQLFAIRRSDPAGLARARSFLMIPDYLNFRLTGVKMNEYTNASTTNLLALSTKSWDPDLLARLGISSAIFGEPRLPGTPAGEFSPAVRDAVGFSSAVLLAPSHDTASAVMSVPYTGDDGIFLSSGTWSLIGVENPAPNTSALAHSYNFTNEGGYEYRYRFLKNIMGLWMLQNLRKEFTRGYSFEELNELAQEHSAFPTVLNVNDEMFLSPRSMTGAIRDYCRQTGQKEPACDGEFLYAVYSGLAFYYARVTREIEEVMGRTYRRISIIGGGCQDRYLNYLTARETGKEVFAGPVEGTAVGNLVCQMIARGEYADLKAARENIALSFDVKQVQL